MYHIQSIEVFYYESDLKFECFFFLKKKKGNKGAREVNDIECFIFK